MRIRGASRRVKYESVYVTDTLVQHTSGGMQYNFSDHSRTS